MSNHVSEISKNYFAVRLGQRKMLEHQRALGGLFIEYQNDWRLNKGTSTDRWIKDELPRVLQQLSEISGVGTQLLSKASVYRYMDIYKYWDTIVERGWTNLSATQIASNLSKLKKGQEIYGDAISELEAEAQKKVTKHCKSNQLVEAALAHNEELKQINSQLQAELEQIKAELALLKTEQPQQEQESQPQQEQSNIAVSFAKVKKTPNTMLLELQADLGRQFMLLHKDHHQNHKYGTWSKRAKEFADTLRSEVIACGYDPDKGNLVALSNLYKYKYIAENWQLVLERGWKSLPYTTVYNRLKAETKGLSVSCR